MNQTANSSRLIVASDSPFFSRYTATPPSKGFSITRSPLLSASRLMRSKLQRLHIVNSPTPYLLPSRPTRDENDLSTRFCPKKYLPWHIAPPRQKTSTGAAREQRTVA